MDEQSEQAIEWILALADSSFEQIQKKLGDVEKGMCCLGVANHISSLGRDPSDGFLQMGALGLRGGESDSQCDLTFLNDFKGYTHPQIAAELIKRPRDFFIPRVASAVEEYFYREAS